MPAHPWPLSSLDSFGNVDVDSGKKAELTQIPGHSNVDEYIHRFIYVYINSYTLRQRPSTGSCMVEHSVSRTMARWTSSAGCQPLRLMTPLWSVTTALARCGQRVCTLSAVPIDFGMSAGCSCAPEKSTNVPTKARGVLADAFPS